ncbi:MAG TPA: hypothetical protein VEW48_23945 [Thermoanaerobaculia bacterium]|nr:hypothetical protein [Thermoanaerobaculia bacterium]
MNADRISFRDALARAAVPLAALAAMAALASREVDPVGAAETAYLAVLATAGLLAVAFLAPAPAWEAGVGATLATTIVWALPPGPGRGAAVVLLLVAALAVAAGRRFPHPRPLSRERERGEQQENVFALLPSPARGRGAGGEGFLLPLSFGLQVLLRGSELLFQPQVNLRTLVALLGLPVAGAAATAVLARRYGPAALAAAGAALLLAPGWNVAATAGLVALAAGDLIARWRGAILATAVLAGAFLLRPGVPDLSMAAGLLALAVLYLGRKILAVTAVAIAALLLTTALLASYPWLRSEPLQEALGLFVHIPTPGTSLLPPATAVVVDAAHPSWRVAVTGKSVDTVVLDSSLSNGAGLPNGTPVATVHLRGGDGRIYGWVVRAGQDTGEWAARRPDVAAASVLKSPPPWLSWVAGGFFGQRYRSLWNVDSPGSFTELSIERNPALPPQVSLALHAVEIRKPFAARLLPAGDPFRGTLAVLPLVLAALWAIARWSVRRGAEPLSRAGSAGELAALAVLVLCILARPGLGLAWSAEVLAAGLVLVLGFRAVRQVRALRPLLGDRLPRRPSLVFFLLPLTVYVAILPWSTVHRQPDGDEPFYLLITHSLAYDFDAELTNNYAHGDWRHFMERPIEPQAGDPVGPHGELYSRHNELLPLALVPAYRVGGRIGALGMMAAFTALLAWLMLRLGRHYVPDRPGEVLSAWALAVLAPPLLLYSYQVWVEVPAALLMLFALDRILDLDGQRQWTVRQWLGIGLSILLLPLLKMRFVLISGPLLALAWWYSGRPRRPVFLLTAALALLGVGMLAYNQAVYGNPLKIHTWEEVDPHRHDLLSYWKGGLGLLWDSAFGLFGCAPIWLIVLPAVLLLLARRHRLLIHLAVLTLPYLLVVVPRIEWYGGWSPPFRYALIGLPFLSLALAPLLERRDGPGARALLAGLGTLTLALALLWLVMPGWTYNFADGRTYLLDALGQRLGLDVARFFPSSIRPRPATWLWPPLTILFTTVLWWFPFRRGGQGVRVAGLAGVAAVLLLAAAVPPAAARLPTTVAEIEDPQVAKSGGHLYPDRWIIERARHRGGWVLRVGERVKVPVKAGGRRVCLVLRGELVQNQLVPFRLDIQAGDRLLAVWAPGRDRAWDAVTLGPFDWPAGKPLVLSAFGPHPPGEPNGIVLDRVDFAWE